jgi:glycosyltransferase involved in cell wall biosynthesis
VSLRRLLERIRDLALAAALWGQRQNWPVPRAVHNLARQLLARPINQASAGASIEVDEWPKLIIQGGRVDVQRRSSGNNAQAGEAGMPSATPVDTAHEPLWPGQYRRLRCLVAMGTLGLGGLEVVALFLARGLPSCGLDTIVAHTPPAGEGKPRPDSLRPDGVPLVTLSRHNVRPWLEAHKPDVVSMHGPPDWFVAAAAEAGVPTIETLHGAHTFFDRALWPKEEERSRRIAGFVAVSELIRRQYLRANPDYPPERVVTIPNGVDVRHIVHRDRAQARTWLGFGDEFLFVSLARYAPQKNAFGLVTAFSDVARACPEARLILAGDITDPLYYGQVRRLRDGLPCADKIHLHGPCPDVSTVLAAGDAFVLDSFFEGWPLASMEALFAGLPVILSEVAGAREQIGENHSRGFVVGNPLGNPESTDWAAIAQARFSSQINRATLVDAMCAVIAERDHWRRAREDLRAESVNRFSIDVCLQRHAKVLTHAASIGAGWHPAQSVG